jgi:hypothetical protein
MDPFKDQNLPRFLREYGFRVVQPQSPAPGIGDGPVILESDQLRVRFYPGRELMGAQLARIAEPDRWWAVPEVLDAMDESRPQRNPDLSALAASVRQQFPSLVQAYGPRLRQTRRILEGYGQQRDLRSQAPMLNGVPLGATGTRSLKPVIHALIWIVLLSLLLLAFRR